MTLVVTAIAHSVMWMAADRRLSEDQKALSFDAVKLMQLSTRDSHSTIAYVGQGGKYPLAHENEVSQWLKRTLRGIDCDYDTATLLICQAAEKKISHREHSFVVSGFVKSKPVITLIARETGYVIKDYSGRTADRRTPGLAQFGYKRLLVPNGISAVVAIHGSGSSYIYDMDRIRLLRLVRKTISVDPYSLEKQGLSTHENAARHQVWRSRANAVSAYIAYLIRKASERTPTVSPDCILAIRSETRKSGWFTTFPRSEKAITLPAIACGLAADDFVKTLGAYLEPIMKAGLEEYVKGIQPNVNIDIEELNKILSTLPYLPDDSF